MSDPQLAHPHRTKRGTVQLCAPGVGWWVGGPAIGQILVPGAWLGGLEMLGRTRPLAVPPGAGGRVVQRHLPGWRRAAVEHGTVLVELDVRRGSVALGDETEVEAETAPAADMALVFRAPMSGRLYHRQSPGQPPFVQPGDIVEAGQTVCLLEVMKTFNRVVYGGPDLPARARIVRVLVDDGADVSGRDPLFELEAS